LLSSLHRSLGVLLLAGSLLLAACGDDDDEGYSPPSAAEKKKAIRTAHDLYFVATTYSDLDISRGPCIGNKLPNLGPDWVVDIAHDPRQPIDDEPRNQCPKARSGQAQHFVELDPQGKVIRVR
jgi:hypothetical protein